MGPSASLTPSLSIPLAVVLAAAAAAPGYGGPSPSPTPDRDARAAAAAVVAGYRAGNATPPQLDGRLAAAAATLAARASAERKAAAATDGDALRLALSGAGVCDAAPVPIAFRAGQLELAVARLRERAEKEARAKDMHHDRFGVAVARSGDEATIVLLFARRRAELAPFPREVALGSSHVLDGRVLPPLKGNEIYVTPPSGTPVKLPAEAAGATFRARVAFATRGRHVVEVLGHGPRGPEVALYLDVWAGEPMPAPGAPAAREPEPEDLAGKEALVAAEVNALRRAKGLGALAADPALARVARAYAEEILRTGRFAHRSEESGEVSDRLRTAGYAYARAAENLAQAPSARLAHRSTVESPGHFANLLDPSWSHAGYGLAAGKTPGGAPTLFLVEVFAVPPTRSADPAADVANAAARRRQELGRPALRRDARLDRIAGEHAQKLADADTAKLEASGGGLAEKALQVLGPGSLAGADLFLGSRPEDAAASEGLASDRFDRIGVGVARTRAGSRLGEGRWFIVLVFGRAGAR